jgi:hypothetical protein
MFITFGFQPKIKAPPTNNFYNSTDIEKLKDHYPVTVAP